MSLVIYEFQQFKLIKWGIVMRYTYVNVKCPNCKQLVDHKRYYGSNIAGSPIKRCAFCGAQFFSDLYREKALEKTKYDIFENVIHFIQISVFTVPLSLMLFYTSSNKFILVGSIFIMNSLFTYLVDRSIKKIDFKDA
jgi:hypothetical protein